MEIKEIYDLYKDYLEKEIVVKGWIRKHRKQKEIGFIDISDGTCERSGFGIGFERLLMYITGIKNIRDVIPYPRIYGSCEF